MDCISRRCFVSTITLTALAATSTRSLAQAGAHVAETDEQAIALSYKEGTTKVDAAKFPKHTPAQRCSNCSFWQGTPTDAWAGCAMFGRKHVANAGWCQVWAKVPG